MKRLIFKSFLYVILIIIALEVYVRVFHLTKDYPSRYVDNYGVEKWRPNQSGFSVTGNRKQNFSEYHINSHGFNSYREFNPTKENVEIALVGDSFIEGFHQNYYNSIGKKIENDLPNVDVYEFGYAGYDFADQLHLVSVYKELFETIDQVYLGIKFKNDLYRDKYAVLEERMKLESPLYKNLRKIKILTYAQSIGLLDPVREAITKLLAFRSAQKTVNNTLSEAEKKDIALEKHKKYLENFKHLLSEYGYDKTKFILFLDESETPKIFTTYLKTNGFKYLDISKALHASKKPTTLIYDKHWNNNGRNIVAKCIVDYHNNNFNKKIR